MKLWDLVAIHSLSLDVAVNVQNFVTLNLDLISALHVTTVVKGIGTLKEHHLHTVGNYVCSCEK